MELLKLFEPKEVQSSRELAERLNEIVVKINSLIEDSNVRKEKEQQELLGLIEAKKPVTAPEGGKKNGTKK